MEQHQQAGRAGGEATSASHGHDFYVEIGRKGGKNSHGGNPDASAAHHNAAGHHDAAAYHHRQAAYHHSRGESDEAQEHSDHAQAHHEAAGDHSNEAEQSGVRGGTSEQHAKAGSQSHKNS